MRSGRIGAIAILALALVGYLRRRVWWSYAAPSGPPYVPRPAYVARQADERLPYIARVTDDWRTVAAAALPVLGAGLLVTDGDALLPAAWIAASGRPDVADLARVIRYEVLRAATQWLYDDAGGRIVLVVATIEPVSCSFAVAFDARRHATTLRAAAGAEQLALLFGPAPVDAERSVLLPAAKAGAALVLPLDAPAQLRAILGIEVPNT